MFRHNVIRGKKCEHEFEMLLKREGIFNRKATEREDRFDHIDYWLKFEIPEASPVSMSVDVKSLKKVRGQFQDELFYIEMINDNGNKGWVHAPKMDLVAFECNDGFRMYRREKLGWNRFRLSRGDCQWRIRRVVVCCYLELKSSIYFSIRY